jgi:hypothetical protein
MSPENMKAFESAMWLKDIKVGETVTERHVEAIEFLVGPLLNIVRKMQPTQLFSVNFTDNGNPYTTDGNPLGVTVDGKRPFDMKEQP